MSSVAQRLRSHDRPARVRGGLFYALLLVSMLVGFLTLGALLVDVLLKGLNWTGATVDLVLLLEPPSADPALAAEIAGRAALGLEVYTRGAALQWGQVPVDDG